MSKNKYKFNIFVNGILTYSEALKKKEKEGNAIIVIWKIIRQIRRKKDEKAGKTDIYIYTSMHIYMYTYIYKQVIYSKTIIFHE